MSKGFIAMFKEAFISQSPFFDAEIISLATTNKRSSMDANNTPFGKPTSDISEIALVKVLDVTIGLDITVVMSILYYYPTCKELHVLFFMILYIHVANIQITFFKKKKKYNYFK